MRAPAVLISRNGPRELGALCFRSTLQVPFQVDGKAARKTSKERNTHVTSRQRYFFTTVKRIPQAQAISRRSSINPIVPPLSICITYLTLLNATRYPKADSTNLFDTLLSLSLSLSLFPFAISRGIARGSRRKKNGESVFFFFE